MMPRYCLPVVWEMMVVWTVFELLGECASPSDDVVVLICD